MSNKTIFDELDPEIVQRMTSEPEAVHKANQLGAALNSPTVALGALSMSAFGPKLPQNIVDVLNFAFTLENLESEFYSTAVKSASLIPAGDRKVFETINDHEIAHVKLLGTVLGKSAAPKPAFDYTAGGAFADVFSNYQTFLAVSQAFEDTGVRAYKGQAANLMSNDKLLTVALTIHSVEARHASEVRRLRGQKGWITGDSRGDLPAATQAIYDGDNVTTQGGADLTGVAGVSADAVSEAFDEPLTKEQVLAIVRPFIKG